MATGSSFPYRSLSEKRDLILSGQLDLLQNVRDFLLKIEKSQDINAYIYVDHSIMQKAEVLLSSLKGGKAPGRLFGAVIAVKDVISVVGMPLTCASKMLEGFQPVFNATIIDKLLSDDALIIGKLNCDEFAMGATNTNSAFGAVLNPVDKSRVPGGSSGGSAAAVAAGLCDVAIGSDTGGSIRQPAAFCGVYGIKPTYSRVSRYGLTAFASSFDSIGPLANSVDDCALVLDVISGYDPLDSTSYGGKLPSLSPISPFVQNEFTYSFNPDEHPNLAQDTNTPVSDEQPNSAQDTNTPVSDEQPITIQSPADTKDISKKLKIALPKEYFGEGLNPEIKSAVEEIASKLVEAGHIVEEVSLPNTKYAIAAYYVLTTAEAASNLSRYDGVRYGKRSKINGTLSEEKNRAVSEEKSGTLAEMYINTRSENLGKEVKRRIMLGNYVLSGGYYEAYFGKAQKVRRLIKNDFTKIFKDYDLILTPVTPEFPAKFGEMPTDPLAVYLGDIYTTSVNLAGLPAVSVPIGCSSQNLPLAAQFIGKEFEENTLLSVAKMLESLLQ
ncbi:MAG: amidase family protein [Ignavibacteriaceae bacterium]|nr:MAG: amidase family protein [Ignavibacteriaceae bacterium]